MAIDIVYVFGAGCVQGAWEPVLRAVEKMVHHPVGRDVADWWFGLQGNFTHLIASWGRLKDEELEGRFGKGDHSESRRRMARQDEQSRAEMSDLKYAIAEELRTAHAKGEIRVREELLEKVAVDAGHGRTAILTANWDLCLDKWLEGADEPVKIVHLHGDISEPNGMLLPGERPEELFRNAEDNARITNAYWRAMIIFSFARRVYAVGLSLSPLDAALGVALGLGLKSARQPGEIVVVNRKADMDRIVRQIRMLAPDGWRIRQMPVG